MGKLTIYIDGMSYQKIKTYAQEKKIPISKVFVRGALSYVSSEPVPKCEISGCKTPSMGKYKINLYSVDQGEYEVIKNLCEYHRKRASQEGEVKEFD